MSVSVVELSREERDVLWDELALLLERLKLKGGDPIEHIDLTAPASDVLDDIGWQSEDPRDHFDLTVPKPVRRLLQALRDDRKELLAQTRALDVDHELEALYVINAILERADDSPA